MTAPKKWRKKLLLFKIESAYATDPTPTGGANAILATQVALEPMLGNEVNRDLERPYLGADDMIPSELHRRLTFKVELEPSGTEGEAPAWGPLLRACAMAETVVADTSVTYNPVSDSHESGTFYLNIDGTLFKMTGARGNCVIEVNAQGIVYLNFTFTGLYSAASETALATPDYTRYLQPKIATSANTPTFTIDGTDFVLRSLSLDLGNQVETRFLIGEEEILITDKAEVLNATVKAVPLTTLDPMALAIAQTAVEVQLVHGTAAGRIATLDVPTAQFGRLSGLENAQNIVEWPLRMIPLPASGNDQFTLTLT